MRARQASSRTAVIGAGVSGMSARALHPDNTPHFQYISAPQAVLKA